MTKPFREDAVSILRAAIERVDPGKMIEKCLRITENQLTIETETETLELSLGDFDRMILIGAGKAGARMARAIERVFSNRIADGVIAVKPGHVDTVERVRLIEGGHPVPNAGSVEAARAILELAQSADERTLVINAISGGGSALVTLPHDGDFGITLEDMQAVTGILLACGSTIQEINTVRKHLSAIKGGRLAAACAPATVVSLILSDVVGDDLSSIASGLTVPDPTTFADARDVLDRCGAVGHIPDRVVQLFDAGTAGEIDETPKPGDSAFANVHNVLIGTNGHALSTAWAAARELGYNPLVLTSQVTGEAREIARMFVGIARDLRRMAGQEIAPVNLPACVIAGGETTVTIRGNGTGGRNQEMVAAFLNDFAARPAEIEGILFVSAGTDGNDGPTDAAGGFADAEALRMAEREGVSISQMLADNDSYHLLGGIGALLKTGPTNTNVCDIQVLLVR